MTQNMAGWVLAIAALGMMAGLLGNEIASMPAWDTVWTPAFVGKALGHLGTVIAAYVGGRLGTQLGKGE